MKRLAISIMCCSIFLWGVPAVVLAKNYSNALLPKEEKLDVICTLKDNGESHAKHSMLINSFQENDQWYYEFSAEGFGDYDTFKNVHWTKQSTVIDANGLLKPLKSEIKIYNRDGKLNTRYAISYDYRQNKVHFYTDGPEYSKPRHHSFPIKGPICDDVTMIHFLKAYIPRLDNKGDEYFYLVTNEPNVYKVRVVEDKRETLDLPIGRLDTVKIQAYALMGPLTHMMKAILPPTYLWYEDKYPYNWVKYQGLDGGPNSENIIAVVEARK